MGASEQICVLDKCTLLLLLLLLLLKLWITSNKAIKLPPNACIIHDAHTLFPIQGLTGPKICGENFIETPTNCLDCLSFQGLSRPICRNKDRLNINLYTHLSTSRSCVAWGTHTSISIDSIKACTCKEIQCNAVRTTNNIINHTKRITLGNIPITS